MPRKAEVVRAMPCAGTIMAWAAWLPSIAGLADLVRVRFISPLTGGMVYPRRFTNLNPLNESCSNAVFPSFLPQTQKSNISFDIKLKAQRILDAIRSGATPESDGGRDHTGSASQCDQWCIWRAWAAY